MNVKILQFQVHYGDKDANYETVRQLFSDENLTDTDTVVLPEMWTTGYDLEHVDGLACYKLEPTLSFVVNLAIEYNVNIIAGSIANAVDEGGYVYNTSFAVDKKGTLVYEYSKIHLVPMLNEPQYLIPGNRKVETFELAGETCGLVICYDLRFPEVFRDLTMLGAKIIFVVAEWPSARRDHWITLLKARAIENQCYLIASNTYGNIGEGSFAGVSMIIDPFGEVMDQGSIDSEETLQASADAGLVQKVREDVPVFDSRRRDMYRFL